MIHFGALDVAGDALKLMLLTEEGASLNEPLRQMDFLLLKGWTGIVDGRRKCFQ